MRYLVLVAIAGLSVAACLGCGKTGLTITNASNPEGFEGTRDCKTYCITKAFLSLESDDGEKRVLNVLTNGDTISPGEKRTYSVDLGDATLAELEVHFLIHEIREYNHEYCFEYKDFMGNQRNPSAKFIPLLFKWEVPSYRAEGPLNEPEGDGEIEGMEYNEGEFGPIPPK